MQIIKEHKSKNIQKRDFIMYITFLPCDYVRHFEDGTDAEVTKTFQAVA